MDVLDEKKIQLITRREQPLYDNCVTEWFADAGDGIGEFMIDKITIDGKKEPITSIA